MSDTFVLSLQSLGREIGSLQEHSLQIRPIAEWSTEVAQWLDQDFPIRVELQSLTDGVLVSVAGELGWTALCSRCAEEVRGSTPLNAQDVFFYPDSPVVTEAEEDEEFYLIENDSIDLEPFVRDELILGLPTLPLCSPDCEGLCDVCGEPWAKLPEDHAHEEIDPRWSALAVFAEKLDSSEEMNK
ncbi:hypothetical protein BM477_01575 [Boudabousia marimammalium]|uniref:Metal-binding protein n=2 Tax=Boudabousia marimammalium TaxID=156892 RepID=A0A1Q5PS02_9ACTO|nr:hypothetical protein BM477_01575 [Boudabousia marimammalium]